jgi:hypothetical protein
MKSALWLISASSFLALPSFAWGQGPDLRPPSISGNVAPKSAQITAVAGSGAPLGTLPRRPTTGRYRYQNGRWWYLSRENKWFVWQGGRWLAYMPVREPDRLPSVPAVLAETRAFHRRFAGYLQYSAGQRSLETAEGGNVELATDEVTEPGASEVVSEAFMTGGIPPRQAERRHVGVRLTVSEVMPDWFRSGSPFGNRYGYGSGFAYGGYGFDNPYGYGPRNGSGGGFAFTFGPYGSMGNQMTSRVSAIGGGTSNTLGRNIPGTLGLPNLRGVAVGGTTADPLRRKLGGSATSRGGRD